MEIILRNENKKINFDVKKCGRIKMFLGLMFSRREKAKSLLFEFKKPTNIKLHSFFVFFPFLVLWLDKDNKIIKMKKVKPFRLSVRISEKFSKIIEIPFNKRYKNVIKNIKSPSVERFKYL
jgi:uncharacterized membrane protein (UPF0127 family)